jgi:hypothetical protein
VCNNQTAAASYFSGVCTPVRRASVPAGYDLLDDYAIGANCESCDHRSNFCQQFADPGDF